MYKVNWVYNDTFMSAEFATLRNAFVAARALIDGGIQQVYVPCPTDEDATYLIPKNP